MAGRLTGAGTAAAGYARHVRRARRAADAVRCAPFRGPGASRTNAPLRSMVRTRPGIGRRLPEPLSRGNAVADRPRISDSVFARQIVVARERLVDRYRPRDRRA